MLSGVNESLRERRIGGAGMHDGRHLDEVGARSNDVHESRKGSVGQACSMHDTASIMGLDEPLEYCRMSYFRVMGCVVSSSS
jgi:hypothetical protein